MLSALSGSIEPRPCAQGGEMDRDGRPQAGEDSTLWVLACSGTGGDILPFIDLGKRLAERGRRVRLAAPAYHADWIRRQGLDCEAFGSKAAFQACLDDPDLWDERKGFGVVWRSVAPHLQVLRELAARESGRCVLLCHPLMLAAAHLAKAAYPDLTVAALYLSPSGLCSSHDMQVLGSLTLPARLPVSWKRQLWRCLYRLGLDPQVLPAINAARREMGLPPLRSFQRLLSETPEQVFGGFPSWFAAPQPDWPSPYQELGFPQAAERDGTLSAELQAFIDAGPAPVVFTPGTGHRHARGYFEAALAALAAVGGRGIFITPYRDQVPEALPGHVLWQPHAPFSAILPKAAAVVHHGGIGTCAEAFRAGVPQLICPYAFDQFDNGWRARRLGVAEVLPARKLSAKKLAAALRRLSASGEVARACERTAAQARASGFASVELLEQALMDAVWARR
ncbi:glycosyltransferase [Chromobacterium sp. IIBBL 290-4]|uniref:glycosyltransferase n=1 Tax=Chromobacterium sp. IIBBL 290-4 TaxID=2953890 RepID=UPI0020B72C2B|nr:glycosyltransferase [Chromobacterium sp. IIBBL 290-4]UTH75939.1 glycosyltransferase [Chromobacterium sp. IIBBL 290-4]